MIVLVLIILSLLVIRIIANSPENIKKRALKSWMNYGAHPDAPTLTQTFLMETNEENIDIVSKFFEDLIIANGISALKYSQNLLYSSSSETSPKYTQNNISPTKTIFYNTPSAYNFDEFMIWPPNNAPKWSLIAFPDVWRWFNQLAKIDEDKMNSDLKDDLNILANSYLKNTTDGHEGVNNEKDKVDMVRKMVEMFKKHSGKPFECRANFF